MGARFHRAALLLLALCVFGPSCFDDAALHASETDCDARANSAREGCDTMRHVKVGSGAGAPTGTPSSVGDFYVDTTTGNVYQSKVDAAGVVFWELGGRSARVLRGWVDTTPAATLSAAGTVLTANANGLFNAGSPGGIGTWAVGDLLGVSNAATAEQGGEWQVTDVGAAGAPWVLTRPSGARDSAGLYPGAQFFVGEGTYASSIWSNLTSPGYVVGVDPLLFARNITFAVKPLDLGSTDTGAIMYGSTFTLEWVIPAGVPGAPDDVALLAGGAPFAFTPLDSFALVSTAIALSSVQVRGLAGGAGAVYSGPIATDAAGRIGEGLGGGRTALAGVALAGPMFLRRADAGVALTLIMYARRAAS